MCVKVKLIKKADFPHGWSLNESAFQPTNNFILNEQNNENSSAAHGYIAIEKCYLQCLDVLDTHPLW